MQKALLRLKEINAKSFQDLRRGSRVFHFGEVEWKKTSVGGFPDFVHSHVAAFHFSLLNVNNQLAGVYGGYYDGVFDIVWFDLNHEVWQTDLKHT